MAEEIQPVNLYDPSILPWKRSDENMQQFILDMYNDNTELIKELGIDIVDKTTESFRIVGSATKYLANITHHKDTDSTEVNTAYDGENILFSGGLTIYRITNPIPGTNITGFDFERQDRIWTSQKPEKQFYSSDGLKNLIFDGPLNDADRIESILLGYEEQEMKRQHAQKHREFNSFIDGNMSKIPRKLLMG